MRYVFDSSSLIYLGKLKLLEKVGKLNGKMFIPRNVYKEVVTKGFERGDPEALYLDKLIKNNVFVVKSAASSSFASIQFLSEADKEVLGLSKAIKSIAVIDETYAKRIAKIYGIKCHGTIYMLLKLMENKLMTKKEVIDCIDRMIRLGFYLSAENYREIIDIIENYRS